MFDEVEDTYFEIKMFMYETLIFIAGRRGIHYKVPVKELVRRFLNEIVEFEPLEEVRRSSLKPWQEG